MKELLTEFEGRGEVSGNHFKQLMKSSSAYMYEKFFEGIRYYEVFQRKENARFNTVSYPTSASFGIWAWDYANYDRAIAKFESL
jgi:hypothetical protein